MTRLLFGAGPYGGVSTENSLAAITPNDVAAAHAAYWRPDNAVLVIAGDISAEAGFALAERTFGDWAPAQSTLPAPLPAAPPNARRAIVVDLPDSGQAAVSFGLVGPSRSAEDYFPSLVANSVLGGGFSSRLSSEIRIKRGLSYGAYSSFPARSAPAPIVAFAQTRNDAAAQVVGLMRDALRDLGAAPIPAAELDARKSALIGGFARDVETTSGLAGQLAQVAAFDLPLEALASYVADVSAVDAAATQAAARRHFDPTRANVVVVGDADIFFNDLRRAERQAERIAIDDVDFDKPALH
jgi:zinc protease